MENGKEAPPVRMLRLAQHTHCTGRANTSLRATRTARRLSEARDAGQPQVPEQPPTDCPGRDARPIHRQGARGPKCRPTGRFPMGALRDANGPSTLLRLHLAGRVGFEPTGAVLAAPIA